MSKDTTSRPLRNDIEVDEGKIQSHLSEMVRRTVEETLNNLLDAEAERCMQRRSLRTNGTLYSELIPNRRCRRDS